jgi:Icc protein
MNRRIAYITDIHLEEQFPIEQGVDSQKNWEIILDDISSKNINEIIFGGDIGDKSSHQYFFNSLKKYKIALSLGNHDSFEEVVKYYKKGIYKKQDALYHSQEYPVYKFIFLDSSTELISNQQFNWFKSELVTDKKIILFIHHPILPINTEVDRRFALKQRHQIEHELLNIENDIILFCGHYHLEDKKIKANITQYITPSSSVQVEKSTTELKFNSKMFGYRIIELSEEELTTEIILF